MKRAFASVLVFILIITLRSAHCQNGSDSYQEVTLRPGEQAFCQKTEVPCNWTTDAPEVALVSADGIITAMNEGFASLTTLLPDGSTAQCDVTVDCTAAPLLIRQAIDYALSEWKNNLGNGFSRSNKYTQWYSGKPSSFGWCGAFIGYCLDQVGIGMEYWADSVPVPDGSPFAVREAGVGKLLKGYARMQRTSQIPRPGYLVIYGVRGGSSSTIHVGLITAVQQSSDGLYRLQTVEGNVSNRIKRYSYIYNQNSKGSEINMQALPEAEQTDSVFQYDLHQDNWYINVFCQTWF